MDIEQEGIQLERDIAELMVSIKRTLCRFPHSVQVTAC